jgi:hypothetical protein
MSQLRMCNKTGSNNTYLPSLQTTSTASHPTPASQAPTKLPKAVQSFSYPLPASLNNRLNKLPKWHCFKHHTFISDQGSSMILLLICSRSLFISVIHIRVGIVQLIVGIHGNYPCVRTRIVHLSTGVTTIGKGPNPDANPAIMQSMGIS